MRVWFNTPAHPSLPPCPLWTAPGGGPHNLCQVWKGHFCSARLRTDGTVERPEEHSISNHDESFCPFMVPESHESMGALRWGGVSEKERKKERKKVGSWLSIRVSFPAASQGSTLNSITCRGKLNNQPPGFEETSNLSAELQCAFAPI